MSTRMRSLFLLGGLAAALVAPNLRASNIAIGHIPISPAPAPGTIIHVDPCLFDQPDLGKCNDASWRASACGQKHVADCVSIRQDEYKSEWAANNNQQPIIGPDGFANSHIASNGKV